jgi:catechol-2,3-dioxygenase
MERVTGIGGFFFRASDPPALARWYATHLGIDPSPATYNEQPWHQQAGPTVLHPFPQSTTYFGSPERQWMINFRVRDLHAMLKQLRTAGINVQNPESHPNGLFSRLQDPEGNPIELWQPQDAQNPRDAPATPAPR